jgi:hypothetical protein
MNKKFIPYGLALRLGSLGFDEPCFGYYVEGDLRGVNLGIEQLGGIKPYYQRFGFHSLSNHDIDNPKKIVVTAPTWQQAFRWFREKGYLISFSSHDDSIHDFYIKWQPSKSILSDTYDTYEEAEIACLEKLIEIVEQK